MMPRGMRTPTIPPTTVPVPPTIPPTTVPVPPTNPPTTVPAPPPVSPTTVPPTTIPVPVVTVTVLVYPQDRSINRYIIIRLITLTRLIPITRGAR